MSAQVVGSTADLAPGEALRVEVANAAGDVVEVALVRDDYGDWHAINDVCTHGAVSLADGDVEGTTIECWLHGSQFDLRSGAPLQLPATIPVAVYELTIDGDLVFVDVDKEN